MRIEKEEATTDLEGLNLQRPKPLHPTKYPPSTPFSTHMAPARGCLRLHMKTVRETAISEP